MSRTYQINQHGQYQEAGSQICYPSPEDCRDDNPGHFIRVLSFDILDGNKCRIVSFELIPETEATPGGKIIEREANWFFNDDNLDTEYYDRVGMGIDSKTREKVYETIVHIFGSDVYVSMAIEEVKAFLQLLIGYERDKVDPFAIVNGIAIMSVIIDELKYAVGGGLLMGAKNRVIGIHKNLIELRGIKIDTLPRSEKGGQDGSKVK